MVPYKVTFKMGRSSFNHLFYSSSLSNVLAFCENNIYADVQKVERLEYQSSDSKVYPVDDPSFYKSTHYFHVRSDEGLSQVFTLKCIKSSRTVMSVFQDMKSLLKLPSNYDIDSLVSCTESTKS